MHEAERVASKRTSPAPKTQTCSGIIPTLFWLLYFLYGQVDLRAAHEIDHHGGKVNGLWSQGIPHRS